MTRSETEVLEDEIQYLRARNQELKHELTLNASMLAKQTDMAREEPDITIICRNEGDKQDAQYCMATMYPNKYKFIGHTFLDGVHVLTYRRV